MPGEPSSRDAETSGCVSAFGLLLVLGGAALAVYTWRLPRGSRSGDDLVFRATMSLVILGIGVVLIALGRVGGKAARTTRRLSAEHPDRPWLWREDWAQGHAEPESTSQARTFLAAGAMLLLLSAPLLLRLRAEVIERRNYPALLGLAFPLVGLTMLGSWALRRLRRRKFERLRFAMSGVPGILGGPLAGRIEGAFRLPAGTGVHLVLSCVRSYVSGSGTDRPRWQQVLWQDKQTVAALLGGPEMTSIPVEFAIPYDARETDSRNPSDVVLWRLTASADIPGLDFQCFFLVPVFKTESSDPTLTIAALEAASPAHCAEINPPASRILSGPAPGGGLRFYLPPARHKAAAATITLFGMLCLASGLFFGYGAWKALSWIVGVVPVTIFGGMGLLLLLIGFGLWFGATTVEAGRGELRIRSSYLLFSRNTVLRKEEIRDFDLHCGMQRGEEVWYDVRILLANGRRKVAGSNLEKNEAEWFTAALRRELGM